MLIYKLHTNILQTEPLPTAHYFCIKITSESLWTWLQHHMTIQTLWPNNAQLDIKNVTVIQNAENTQSWNIYLRWIKIGPVVLKILHQSKFAYRFKLMSSFQPH